MSAPFVFGAAFAAAAAPAPPNAAAEATQTNVPAATPLSPFFFAAAPTPSSPFHFAPVTNPFAASGSPTAALSAPNFASFGSPAAVPPFAPFQAAPAAAAAVAPSTAAAAVAAPPVNPFASFSAPAFGVASPNATAAPVANPFATFTAPVFTAPAAAAPFTPFVFAPTQQTAAAPTTAAAAATVAAPGSVVVATVAVPAKFPVAIPLPTPAVAAAAAAAPAPVAVPEVWAPGSIVVPVSSIAFERPSYAASTRLLYHDVLQHVFLFLSLRSMHTVHAVCREWQATVVRMVRSIGARVEVVARDRCSTSGETPKQRVERIEYYRRLCGSQLAQKHVRALCNWLVPCALLVEQIPMVSRCLTQLRELRFCVAPYAAADLGLSDALIFPPHLEIVQCTAVHAKEEQMITVVQALAELKALREVELISNVAPLLVPLARCPALRTLRLNCPVTRDLVSGALKLQSLRALHFDGSNDVSGTVFLALAEQPDAQGPLLEELGLPVFNAAIATKYAETLGNSLTSLRPWRMECESLDWLARLPKLQSLRVQHPAAFLSVDAVTRGVHLCPGLTSLELGHMALSSAALEAMLAALPLLRSLSLIHPSALDSLEFLSRGWVRENLQSLVLLHDHLHATLGPADVQYLLQLRALTSLRMVPWLFRRPVDLKIRAAFFDPLRQMSLLTHKLLDTNYDASRD